MSASRIIVSLGLSLISLFFASPTFAQTPISSPSAIPYTTYYIPNTVSPTSPLYTDLLVNNLFHTFSCLAVGQSVIGQPCLSYQVTKDTQGMIQSIPVLSQANLSGGVLGTATSLIGMLYTNPPVRTADYIGSLGEQFGTVKEAHAQVIGSGAQVLSPILKLWQVSRNISYVIMIIIFVVIGIMIMFRHKINPQTVITAQAALPGLVIGLIMITFSFFLAGLVSDMAFVGTNIVGYYFSAVRGQADNPQNLVQDISSRNILTIFTPFTGLIGSGDVAGALGSIWNDLANTNARNATTLAGVNPFYQDPQKILSELAAFLFTQLIMPFGSMFGGPGQLVLGGATALTVSVAPVQVVSLAISFIAMVALIYAMFKLLLRLINNYLTIIYLTLTAPFQLLAAALPGRQGIATNWILNMLANVLAFPAVLAVLYFVAFLVGPDNPINKNCTSPCTFQVSYNNQKQDGSTLVSAAEKDPIKVTNKYTFPLLGGLDLNFINLLLAFGALVALPNIPEIVSRAVGKMGQAGQLIGQEIGANVGAGQRYAGQFQQGVSGFAGQVGRLTNQPGLQYIADPNAPGGFRSIPTSAPGQISRARTGWTSFRNRLGF